MTRLFGAATRVSMFNVEEGPTGAGPRCIEDWAGLTGEKVEIRFQGTSVATGLVDAVTHDGSILWLAGQNQTRKLYEKAEFYEVWVDKPARYPDARGALPKP